MNASITTVSKTTSRDTPAPSNTDRNVFEFCGKGLHYDWRAIVAATEAADLDNELADLDLTAQV